jgi:hypothetical protein
MGEYPRVACVFTVVLIAVLKAKATPQKGEVSSSWLR